MSGRFWQITGLAAAGGVGYYLYNAGGDPKAAEKQFEADASKLTSKVKSQGANISKDAKTYGAEAGAKVDQAIADAKAGVNKADAKLESYRKDAESKIEASLKDARQQGNKAVDAFDKNVTEGAAKAKSGISSWLGGSK
ncbi:Hypothetical protein R9X50_00429300 [Acrodontium crateriforme]|uniref:Calcofluor white hypersensitive protein n=1 Tax=Acrodontium crateriforme TaxID=150365 RepID=A0AAQ3M5U0_9PEZI|nr:Hypothetical protein R9X50_00429300 [Acrodontium crateriforme]